MTEPALKQGRWQRFVDFCNVEEDATPLALSRIVIGTTLFCHCVVLLLTGTTTTVLVHMDHGGLNDVAWASSWATPAAAIALTLVTAACALFVAVGLFTRAALVGAWVGIRVISALSHFSHGGSDALFIDVLFVLMISGCGNALSIDAWRKQKTTTTTTTLRLPRLLLVFQLGLLYFFGGLQKVSYGWVPGGDASALWFALHQPQWTRFDGFPPGWTYPITQAATTSAWLFEVAFPIVVLAVLLDEVGSTSKLARVLRRLRVPTLFLVFGALMHVGIEALLEVGPYLPVTLSMYPAVLGPVVCARLLRRRGP
ncbi:MAG: HTTM domain-containing protein [Deltaproteobacteria bacterium]|nr:HTTM domain-containing protein [Deltaproteobacteria bacterium]